MSENLRSNLLKTKPFQAGDDFSTSTMAKTLGVDRQLVISLIPILLERGDIEPSKIRVIKNQPQQYYRKRAGNSLLRKKWVEWHPEDDEIDTKEFRR